jgi:catalase
MVFRNGNGGLQLFDDTFDFDVLHATKIISNEIVPIKVGRLVLDRIVDNFFAETKQASS